LPGQCCPLERAFHRDCLRRQTRRERPAIRAGLICRRGPAARQLALRGRVRRGGRLLDRPRAVTGAFGDASWSVTVDWAAGLIGIAFAVSLLTGLNLGLPPSIRNLDGDARSLVSESGGLSLLVFALTVLFVGPFASALPQ
jgi:hypothetical protein